MGSKTDAVRTTRRRRRSHDDGVPPDPAPLSDRSVHLVDRTGASASTLRLQGEPATVFGLDDQDGHGRIDDVCRRALSLPTAPPERTTTELWALVWLDRAIAALSCAGAG